MSAQRVVFGTLVQHDEVGRETLPLMPVIGLALAMSVLGERLGEVQVAGVLLALSGIGWAIHDAVRRAPEERTP